MRIFSGVLAKANRAIAQLEALDSEVLTLRNNPHPFACSAEQDQEGSHYVLRLYPAWEPDTQRRWAVIIGEVVHDLRSALDHLVRQAVDLSGGKPDRDHAWPVCREEPNEGFKTWASRTWKTPSGHERHGNLYGVSDTAISLIERCQPYQGGHGPERLAQINALWQCDKHRMLLPIGLFHSEPELELTECELVNRDDRLEEGAYVVEVWVSPMGPNPHVNVKADAPFDIAFGERLLITDLRDATRVVIGICAAFQELFPDAEDLEAKRRSAAFDAWLKGNS